MKSLFNKYIWLQLILSILLLFGGTIIVVFAINGKEDILKDALNIVAAVILFLFGAFAILASFVFETKKYVTNGLLYGSASIALGVFLCMKKLVLLDYLVYLLAIFFIVLGAIELIKAIILTAKDRSKLVPIIITYVFAALFIAGGILAIVFNDKVITAFCIVAGVLLFAAGVWELYLGIKTMIGQNKNGSSKGKKKNKKEEASNQQEQPKQEIREIDYTSDKIEQK